MYESLFYDLNTLTSMHLNLGCFHASRVRLTHDKNDYVLAYILTKSEDIYAKKINLLWTRNIRDKQLESDCGGMFS